MSLEADAWDQSDGVMIMIGTLILGMEQWGGDHDPHYHRDHGIDDGSLEYAVVERFRWLAGWLAVPRVLVS